MCVLEAMNDLLRSSGIQTRDPQIASIPLKLLPCTPFLFELVSAAVKIQNLHSEDRLITAYRDTESSGDRKINIARYILLCSIHHRPIHRLHHFSRFRRYHLQICSRNLQAFRHAAQLKTLSRSGILKVYVHSR